MKPFLKWAGGKHSQLSQILPFLPKGERLFEPFVGAGSVFLNSGFKEVFINDVNPDLINLWKVARHAGGQFIDETAQLVRFIDEESRYNRVRDRFNTREYSDYSQAAFFLALNRTGFNGMCRYNQAREFNIPWGKGKDIYFPFEELRDFQAMALKLQFFSTDFATMMNLSRSGDVIFCDPPYHPMPGKNGFTTYSGKTFDINDQKRLADTAAELRKRNVTTVITNSNAPVIVEMYKKHGFNIYPLNAKRSISCKADTRGMVQDIIAIAK